MPHYLDFFDQALLSIFLAVGCLLGEGFNRVSHLVFDLFHQVDCGEVALPDLLDRLECLMKAFLVEIMFQDISPLLFILVGKLELHDLVILLK